MFLFDRSKKGGGAVGVKRESRAALKGRPGGRATYPEKPLRQFQEDIFLEAMETISRVMKTSGASGRIAARNQLPA